MFEQRTWCEPRYSAARRAAAINTIGRWYEIEETFFANSEDNSFKIIHTAAGGMKTIQKLNNFNTDTYCYERYFVPAENDWRVTAKRPLTKRQWKIKCPPATLGDVLFPRRESSHLPRYYTVLWSTTASSVNPGECRPQGRRVFGATAVNRTYRVRARLRVEDIQNEIRKT